MRTSLYWIRHKDHTDMFSQGYVGISNNINRRWSDHSKGATNSTYLKNAIKKYGWENLVKEIVLIADEKYCLNIENKLRNIAGLGWNIVPGGGMPPSQKGKKRSNKTKAKKSGINNYYFQKGELLQGKFNPNFKGSIIATNCKTGKQQRLNGAKEIILAGFTTSNVYSCVNGKSKMHKNNVFTRELKCQ